jgi:hypothetical protein
MNDLIGVQRLFSLHGLSVLALASVLEMQSGISEKVLES